MSKRKLAVLVLCLVSAAATLPAQQVFVSAGSGATGTQVDVFTANPLTPFAAFQAGAGTFQVLSTPTGSKFYSIANSSTQPVTITDNTFATTHSAASFSEAPIGAVMSPDGTRLAVAAGALHIFDTSTDNELVSGGLSVGTGASIIDLGISLDGKSYFTLATLSGGGSQLNSISAATNAITGTLSVLGTATGLAVGPNGLVYVSTQNEILEVNPTTLVTTTNGVIALNALPTKPVITPDGKYLMAGNLTPVTGSSLILISLATHTVSSTFPNVGFPFTQLLLLGTNEILGNTSQTGSLYTINPNNGGPIAVNGFSLPGVSTNIQGTAVSDEVGAGTRTTAEHLFAVSSGTLYEYDIPSQGITAQQTLTGTGLGGAVSFAGAASTGTEPSTLLSYGANQSVVLGATSLPLVVQALDSTGRPVYGATVTFTPNTGSVSVSPSTVVTGANGYAVTYLTAGSTAGAVMVNAASGTATAGIAVSVISSSGGGGGGGSTSAATLNIVAGQGQILYNDTSTTLGGSPLTVQVTDSSGNPVAGASVTFAVTQGVGVVTPNSAYAATAKTGTATGSYILTTDSNGKAAVDFVTESLGIGASYSQTLVVASASNASPATFYETTVSTSLVPSAYLLKPGQGALLSGSAGSTLTGAVEIQVVSGTGQPLPDVAISLSNGGLDPTKFPSATCGTGNGIVLTSSTGIASCDVVLGGVIGTEAIRANIGNFLTSPSFDIKITTGPPSVVNIVGGNNQTGSPGQQLPQALVVQVTDAGGNILPGVPVNWKVLTAGAVTLSNVSASTDTNGRASALATLGSIAGAAQVQVTAGTGTATFTLTTSIPEAGLQKISGDGQTATQGAAFTAPLVVEVVDANGNPVTGAQVNFAVAEGSATLGSSSVTTTANGQASTTVTAGAAPGAVLITATSGTLTATFTLVVLPQGPSNVTFLNGASFQPGLAPGGIALVTGNNIAPNVQGVISAFNIIGPVPTTLAGVSITFNGTPAPIYYVSNANGQQTVAVQVPFEVQPGNNVSVIITTTPCANGAVTCTDAVLASATFTTSVQQVAPGVFTNGGPGNIAVVVRSDGSYVTAANPAQRGEVVQLYVTGLGVVSPAALTGAAGLANQAVAAQLLVGLNNAGIPFQSAEYAPGLVGVYVITFQVPMTTKAGPSQPVGLLVFDLAGNSFYAQSSNLPIQ